MDLDRLKTIIDWFEGSAVSEFETSEPGFRLHLQRFGAQVAQTEGTVDNVPAQKIPDTGKTVCAESFGLVHLSPEPGAPPFVSVGQSVIEGQQLCIMEAMKVFLPLVSDHAGIISRILIEDGQEVRAGQPLFELK